MDISAGATLWWDPDTVSYYGPSYVLAKGHTVINSKITILDILSGDTEEPTAIHDTGWSFAA